MQGHAAVCRRRLATSAVEGAAVMRQHDSQLALLTQSRHAAIYYSITSSAATSRVRGNVRPSVLAVLRLMTSSNLVTCSNGMSAGFAPRKILSIISAERRNTSEGLAP